MKLLDRFKDVNDLAKENEQLRKKKKYTESQIKEIESERDDIKDKYIALLEEKGAGFNQYLQYYDTAMTLSEEKKELKRNLADLKTEFKLFKENVQEYTEEIISFLPTMSKVDNVNTFFAILKTYKYMYKNLPLKSIANACKRLKITKTLIKNHDEDIYNEFKVEEWKIEE